MARFYAKTPLDQRGFALNPLLNGVFFGQNMMTVKGGAILRRSPRADKTVGTGKAGRMAGLSARPGCSGAGPLGEAPGGMESLDGHPFSW